MPQKPGWPSATTLDRARTLLRDPGKIVPAVRRRVARKLPIARVESQQSLPRQQRLELITQHVDLTGLGLEIGPSHNPLLAKSASYNVRIADYLDRDGLLEKYDGLRPTERIEEVDYVLTGGRLADEIPDRFDYIVASHVIEHTVCLICFLNDCAGLLKDGGVLTLAVPDHRYCFDRFRQRTALGRVIDVHDGNAKVHSYGSVIEHILYQVRKGDKGAWSPGFRGDYKEFFLPERVLEQAKVAAAGEYVDTHNWVFTPHHFRLLVHDLRALGFITLVEKSFTDTVGPEFFVTLSADGSGPDVSRTELLERSDDEGAVREERHFV